MTENGQRIRSIVRAAITLAVAAAVYEALARSGYFAPALLPTLPIIAQTLFATHRRRQHDRARRVHLVPGDVRLLLSPWWSACRSAS